MGAVEKTKEQLTQEINRLKTIISDLEKDKEKYKDVIESSDDLLIRLTLDGYIEYVNPRVEFLYGYKPEELIGKHFKTTTPILEVPKAFEALKKLNAGETLRNFEINQKRKDGSLIPMEINAVPLIRNQKIIGIQGVMRDIWERKQGQKAVLESEEKFRNIFDVSPIGIEHYDADGIQTSANEASLKMFGVEDVSEVQGFNLFGGTTFDAAKREKLLKGESISYQSSFDFEKVKTLKQYKTNKSGLAYFDYVITPLIDKETNSVNGYLLQVQDVTERKMAEQELSISEARFKSLFESLGDAVYVTKMGGGDIGQILEVNHAAIKQTGYSREELLKRNIIKDLYVSGSGNMSTNEWEQKINNGEKVTAVEKKKRKDGTEYWTEVIVTPIEYKNQMAALSINHDITERKKKDEAIKESENKYRSLFTSANDAIFLIKNNRFISCNPKTLEMFDCKKEDVIGQTPMSLSPEYQADGEATSEMAERKINAALKGEPQFFEWLHQRSDGSTFYAEVSLTKIVLSDGIYIQAMVRDISQRKTAEEKQRISDERYRLISDLTSDYLFSVSIDEFGVSKPSWVSGSFEKITGYTFEEYCSIGGWRAIIHEDDLKQDEEVFTQLEKNQEILSIVRTYHKNGNIVWVKVYGHPVWDDKLNRMVGVIGAVEDITEQKRAEKIQKIQYNISLAVNQTGNLDEYIGIIRKELAVLIDTTNFFVATYDEETDTIHLPYIADKYDKHTSFPAANSFTAHVIKTKKSLLVTPRQIEDLKSKNHLDTVGTVSENWLGVPMIIDGNVTGAIVVQSYEDENAYNSRDLEILEFVSHTIGISIERKKSEQDLISALEKATESDRLKSTFLASMSHELRTPLNAIIGFSDIIDEELPIDRILEFAKTINASGNHLLSIVNDLFDITLIESGQSNIKKEKVNLKTILDEVNGIINIEQYKTHKSHIDLSLKIPLEAKHTNIMTDASKLKQVLINLLKNALKFTNEGSVKYGYCIDSSEDISVIKFFVEDTGIGIPENKRELIFDVFRQAEESYTKTHGGTGIGLTISKKIVELLGGEIWLESIEEDLTLGEKGGTVFYFTHPHVFTEQEMGDDRRVISEVLSKQSIDQGAANKKTIIIAEDDASSYQYLKAILNKLDVKIIWFKNGELAVNYCKNNSEVDLILMDINMPVMNGYEATKRIKEIHPDLPIIAQTAYAIVGDRQKSIDAGCDDYISKPIKREDLLNKVEQYLL